MTVADLMQELNEYDGHLEVVVEIPDAIGIAVPVVGVECRMDPAERSGERKVRLTVEDWG